MSKEIEKRKVLGKGLAALLPPKKQTATPPSEERVPDTAPLSSPKPTSLPVRDIQPNPLQPRQVFDPEKLTELANSIRANGIVQPLIVRKHGDQYELIAGERRLRAAKLAELSEVPVVIQDYSDDRLLEVALIENIQREDLNPIETAQALMRLGEAYGLSHEDIANRTGKDRSTVTNMIRLLRLPHEIQILLAERRLSMGHARALLGLSSEEEQISLGEKAAAQGFSVRDVERAVKNGSQPQRESERVEQDPNVKAAVRELESALGTKVKIVEKSGNRGYIELHYFSQDELNRLYELLMGENGAGGRS